MDDYNVDIAEYLRKRRVLDPDLASMKDSMQSTSTVPVREQLDPEKFSPTGYKFAQPNTDETPAMTAYKEGVKKEPLLSDYHPSKLRQVLSRIAGGAVGFGAGGAAGSAMTRGLLYGPYNQQHDQYSQQQKQRGALATVEGQEIENRQSAATAAAKNEQAEAASRASNAQALYNVHRASDYQPTDEAGAIRLNQSKIPPQRPVPDYHVSNPEEGTVTTLPATANGVPINPVAAPPVAKGLVKAIGERDPLNIQQPPPPAPTPIVQKVGPPLGEIREQRAERVRKDSQKFTEKLHNDTQAQSNARSAAQIAASLERQERGEQNMRERPTTDMKNTQERADVVLQTIKETKPQIAKLAGQLGPGSGRWNDFWNGKVGLPDYDLNLLRTDIKYIGSAAVRAHTARGDYRMAEEIKRLSDVAFRSPEDLNAFLDSTAKIMKKYRDYAPGGHTSETPETPSGSSSFEEWDRKRKGK